MARAKTQRLPVVGAAELEYLLGVSQQRAFQLINHREFPQPWVHLRAAKLWLMDDIERWAREHDRNLKPLPADWPPPRKTAKESSPKKATRSARGSAAQSSGPPGSSGSS